MCLYMFMYLTVNAPKVLEVFMAENISLINFIRAATSLCTARNEKHNVKTGRQQTNKTNSVVWVRERTIPTERQPKLVPTFADTRCHVVSVTDPYGRILGFLDRRRYFFFQIAPQLYSRGWVDPVPDPLLLRQSGSAGNRTRTSGSVTRNSEH
jgi:hypothetical protein